MINIGQYNLLRVVKTVDFGVYLTDGHSNVLLPSKYVPPQTKAGDELNVFVYTDSEDRPVATTATPAGCAGDIVSLRAASSSSLGAFLEWGLEKDLFVPFAEMNNKKMIPGKYYVVEIRLDQRTGRIIAGNRFDRIFRQNDPHELKPGEKADLIVWDETDIGYKVIINRKYSGMVYKSEACRTLKQGDHLPGFIFKVRDDGKVDVRLRPDGRAAVLAETDTILQRLKDAGGFLPCNAKTGADIIAEEFHMSKSLFKQIIGKLYKERQIVITGDGIRLAE